MIHVEEEDEIPLSEKELDEFGEQKTIINN
jgi:hypothetical protein